MRCSSVAKTSIALPGCFTASSASASASFFERCRLFGQSRFGVLWTWCLDRPADRLQCLPATLRRDQFEAEFGRTPGCPLTPRPQSAIGRRLAKPVTQPRQKPGFQDRCRCAIAAAQIAESLGSFGIVAGKQLFDPSLAVSCCCRYLRNSVTPRQKPDHLEMPRRCRVLTSHKPLFQLLDTQMIADRRHVPIPRLMALKPICFASPCESPSTSSQSAGNRNQTLRSRARDKGRRDIPFSLRSG